MEYLTRGTCDTMNDAANRTAMTEGRTCAMVMLESAGFIRSQLPELRMDNALQFQTEQICDALAGTGHDILSELFELDELIGSDASATMVVPRLKRLVRWSWDTITQLHELVMALQSAGNQDPQYGLAYVLVAESATNILRAFERTREAVESLPGGSHD